MNILKFQQLKTYVTMKTFEVILYISCCIITEIVKETQILDWIKFLKYTVPINRLCCAMFVVVSIHS